MFGINKQLDFLGVGDLTTDAFIRLKDTSAHAVVNHGERELCLSFGGKIPYDFVEEIRAVGNSANASVSASRLGLNAGLVSNVGNDAHGADCFASLKKNKVDAKFVTKHKDIETNYHYILWFEAERTILVKHQEYPYKFPNINPAPRWLYLSSLSENSLPYHKEIIEYLKKHPETNLAFQPGTFQMKLGYESLKDLYSLTKIFFVNTQEAEKITGTAKNALPIIELAKKLHSLGPKIVVITDGPKGAYAYDGKEAWFMPPYPDPKPPYERTGAGDAFASTFTSAIALGKSIPEALSWAPINSMSVVQYVGSQKGLLTREQLEKYLKEAPTDYKPRKIQ